MSVIDDMLNDVSTLNFDFNAMDLSGFLQKIDKINSCVFHAMDYFL